MPSERYIGHPIDDRRRDLPQQPKAEVLRKGLAKLTKAEMVDVMLEIADQSPVIWRAVAAKSGVELDHQILVGATRKAIHDATRYDKKRINTNFDYDGQAYETVAVNFKILIRHEQWADLQSLAIELLQKGCEQLEMSDEGMMLEDIEACLKPVFASITSANLPVKELEKWLSKMQVVDTSGYVCQKYLSGYRSGSDGKKTRNVDR